MSASTKNKAPRSSSAVTVPVALPELREDQQTVKYWVGTMPGSPIQNITAGGISFPRFRGTPVFDGPNGEPNIPLVYGLYTPLSAEQVNLVMAAIRIRVVRIDTYRNEMADRDPNIDEVPEQTRIRKKVQRARIYMRDSKNYRASPNDIPLARLVYMHRLDAMSAADITDFPPRNMEGDEETDAPASVTAMQKSLKPKVLVPTTTPKE